MHEFVRGKHDVTTQEEEDRIIATEEHDQKCDVTKMEV